MGKKSKIIYTSGCWDLFHIGHLNLLQRSKALGDVLIVGVNTDELIEEYKGEPPVIPFAERFRIILSIGCVDQVEKQVSILEPAELQRLNVDVVTIGDDWKGKHLDGVEWMKEQPNKEVIYFEYTCGISTTIIKQKIIDSAYKTI